jgi:hypothetical protein
VDLSLLFVKLRFGCGMLRCGVVLLNSLLGLGLERVLTVRQHLSWRQCWQHLLRSATALMKRGWHRHWTGQQVSAALTINKSCVWGVTF